MFIDFAGMMININYIINIYKVEDNSMRRQKYCIVINIQNYQNIREIYDNKKERDKRFDELINLINK